MNDHTTEIRQITITVPKFIHITNCLTGHDTFSPNKPLISRSA